MRRLKGKYAVTHMNSFFVEIIIVVFFFIVSTSIIIQVFAKAYMKNLETEKSNMAVLKAQAVCEVFSSNGDIKETVTELFGNKAVAYINKNSVSLSFDKDWKLSNVKDVYHMQISVDKINGKSGQMNYANITVTDRKKILFSVTSSAYLPHEEDSYD